MFVSKKIGSLAVMATALFTFGFSGDVAAQGKHFEGHEKKSAARCYIPVTQNGEEIGVVLDRHSKGGAIMPGASGRHGYNGGTAQEAAVDATEDWTGVKIGAVSENPIYQDRFVKIFNCTPADSSEYDVLKKSFKMKGVFVANPDTGQAPDGQKVDITPRYDGDDKAWKSLFPQPK